MKSTCAPSGPFGRNTAAMSTGRMFATGIALLVLMILATMPMLAHANNAASTGPFVIQQNDYFVNFLMKGLLGDVVNVNSATAQSTLTGPGTLGAIFRVFNLGVAFFGSIIIMFIAVVGILNTGHDGEFLGKRWSSFWVPVRFAGGAAMMLPVTNSGYSFVQAMCLWIAGQGVGFADSVWSAILDNASPRSGSEIVAPISASKVATNIMISSVCSAFINQNATTTDRVVPQWFYDGSAAFREQTARLVWWAPAGVSFANAANGMPIAMQEAPAGSLDGRTVCGEMNYKWAPNAQDPYDGARTAIASVHFREAARMATAYTPLAENFITAVYAENTTSDAATRAGVEAAVNAMTAAIQNDAAAYRTAIITAADTAIAGTPLGATQNLKAVMKQMGFAVAGAFYMELAKTANAVRAGLSAEPTYSPPNTDQIQKDYRGSSWDLIMTSFQPIANAASRSGAAANSTATSTPSSGTTTTVKTIDINGAMFENLGNNWTGWTHSIAMAVLQTVIQVGSSNNVNAGPLSVGMQSGNFNNISLSNQANYSVILQLKNKGDTLLNIAGAVYTGYVAVNAVAKGFEETLPGAAANKLSGIPRGITAALDALLSMVIAVVMGLVTLGIMLAVIIPMTPFMIWIMGIAGLLVLIIEALIASVLWVVMLMHPSGEGVTSDYSRQGLMILLMLFVRPTLMLMGMVAGIFLVDPMVDFVNDMFYFVFQSTQQDTMTGLFIIFGICSVYATLVLAIVRKSFALIHIVPDRVLRWIGGGGEQLGESEVADRGEAMAGNAGQRVSNLTSSNKMSAGQQERFNRNLARQTNNARSQRASAKIGPQRTR